MALASTIAALIATGSWPSTSVITCQLYDLKRPGTPFSIQSPIWPSIEISLSSQKAINFPSPRVPAIAHDS